MSDFDEDHGPGPVDLSADQVACETRGHRESDGWCTECGLLLDVPVSVCRQCARGDHHLHSRWAFGACVGCACPVTVTL